MNHLGYSKQLLKAKNIRANFQIKGIDDSFKKRLLNTDSLTQQVINYCQHQQQAFHLQVLQQGLAKISHREALQLKLKQRERAMVREVLLCAGVTPLIFARTVMPLYLLQGAERQLLRLGNKPLGAYLFSHPNAYRCGLDVMQTKNHWARCSCFMLNSKPLLVYEMFLSQLSVD